MPQTNQCEQLDLRTDTVFDSKMIVSGEQGLRVVEGGLIVGKPEGELHHRCKARNGTLINSGEVETHCRTALMLACPMLQQD